MLSGIYSSPSVCSCELRGRLQWESPLQFIKSLMNDGSAVGQDVSQARWWGYMCHLSHCALGLSPALGLTSFSKVERRGERLRARFHIASVCSKVSVTAVTDSGWWRLSLFFTLLQHTCSVSLAPSWPPVQAEWFDDPAENQPLREEESFWSCPMWIQPIMGALEPAQVGRLTLKKLLDSCTACSVPTRNHHRSPARDKASLWNLLPGAGRGIASKRGRAQGRAGWGWRCLDLKQPQPASFWRCHCGETAELLQRPAAAGRDRWLKSAWMWNPTMAWSIWLGWLWNSSVHFVQLRVCETIP